MFFINTTPGKELKIQHLSLELNSMLLELVNNPNVLELCKSKYLVKDLIVDNLQVTHKLDWPGKVRGSDMMWDPMKLPQYDPEKFPFVMVRSKFYDF